MGCTKLFGFGFTILLSIVGCPQSLDADKWALSSQQNRSKSFFVSMCHKPHHQGYIIFQNPQFFPRPPPLSPILSRTIPPVFIHVSIGAHMPGRCVHVQCENSKEGDLQINKLR